MEPRDGRRVGIVGRCRRPDDSAVGTEAGDATQARIPDRERVAADSPEAADRAEFARPLALAAEGVLQSAAGVVDGDAQLHAVGHRVAPVRKSDGTGDAGEHRLGRTIDLPDREERLGRDPPLLREGVRTCASGQERGRDDSRRSHPLEAPAWSGR
jgi:hypothetical protein